MSLADIANGTVDVAAKTDTKVEKTASNAAASIIPNVLNAGKGVMEALAAPQRGVAGFLKADDTSDDLGANLREGAKWFMDPKKQGQAAAYDRTMFPSDATINEHLSGFPATATRFAAGAGSQVLGDPTTFIPAGAIGKVAKAIPGAAKVGEGIGHVLSPLFNAEHNLGGLTEHGANVVEATRNRFAQAADKAKRVEDQAISTTRNDVKKGVISPEITAAFKKYGAAVPQGVTKPSALMEALDKVRAASVHSQTGDAFEKLGLSKGAASPSLVQSRQVSAAAQHGPLFKNPADTEAALAGIQKHIAPSAAGDNVALKLIAKTNTQLKSMFLAIPLPHVANLTNLAYNKYGLGPTLRGLKYAAQEATGLRGAHLNDLISKLEKSGADNQYGKLFSEVNPVGIGPVSVRNVQRLANKAQDTILNPVERGLRASMMEAEQAAGRTGVDAARNIHKALGSDAPTAMTNFLTHYVPLSQFPRFHTQTALGSFGRTLADKPGRITGFEHVFGGPNQKPDGKPHYHLSTPTASGLKMTDNPLSYIFSPATLGGLSGVTNPYGAIGAAQAGLKAQDNGQRGAARKDFQKAGSALAAPLVPGGPTISAFAEMLKKKKGTAHQTGLEDLLSSLAGGYWSKR